jgi:hypothetical protein
VRTRVQIRNCGLESQDCAPKERLILAPLFMRSNQAHKTMQKAHNARHELLVMGPCKRLSQSPCHTTPCYAPFILILFHGTSVPRAHTIRSNPIQSNPIQSNPIIYKTARVSGPPLAAAHLTHAAVFVTLVPVVDLAPDALAVAPIILARFDE